MPFPSIDPVFLKLGPLQFRWYGLMYVLGFVISYFVIRREVRRTKFELDAEGIADLIFCMAVGVVLGGRLGYVLFYDLAAYLAKPFKIFYIWEGGMSFHGGMLGVAAAAIWFARSRKLPLLRLADLAALAAPVGLGLGRIGNFINGELYGRPTDLPWGIIFPDGGPMPRHPSQLYEAFLEGLVLFFVVRLCARRIPVSGAAVAAFLAGYGLFRSFVELFRQPDGQLGLFFSYFSMGQLLSLPLFVFGVGMMWWLWRTQNAAASSKAQ